jgi:hypothetical protein
MKKTNDEQIKDLLKQSLSPASADLQRDLWPQMLQRIDRRSSVNAVPWFDWALLAVLLIFFLIFPHSIPVFLYHL